MKAKYIGCTHDGWEHTELHYEYRGYTYIVTKHNNGYTDKSLREQHREAQEGIDARIAHKDDPIPEFKYEGSAQEGFDLFWQYVEGKQVPDKPESVEHKLLKVADNCRMQRN